MNYREENGCVIVREIGPVNLANIFENGQCFRFDKDSGGSYAGVAKGKYIRVSSDDDSMILSPCTAGDFEGIWRDYFDLDTDYSALFDKPDKLLKKGMDNAPGLRVLRQEPFETLISFIISANNNIGRIKGIIKRLCERYGVRINSAEQDYYCFPKPESLAGAGVDELKEIGSGYRAPYIKETAAAVRDGFSLEALAGMPYESAKKELMTLKGVGPKVADCILLFSLGHRRAFPADVWIKRVLSEQFGFKGNDRDTAAFAYSMFGESAGIAQQYIFYAARGGSITGD